jgi:hypothetical protein
MWKVRIKGTENPFWRDLVGTVDRLGESVTGIELRQTVAVMGFRETSP